MVACLGGAVIQSALLCWMLDVANLVLVQGQLMVINVEADTARNLQSSIVELMMTSQFVGADPTADLRRVLINDLPLRLWV